MNLAHSEDTSRNTDEKDSYNRFVKSRILGKHKVTPKKGLLKKVVSLQYTWNILANTYEKFLKSISAETLCRCCR